MSSEKAMKAAPGFCTQGYVYHRGGLECPHCKEISIKLDQFAAEARLEEAKWIDANIFKVGKWKIDPEKFAHHIATLTAQAQKGT